MYEPHKVFKRRVKYTMLTEEPSITQRRIVASSEGGHGPEGAVTPYMERNEIKCHTHELKQRPCIGTNRFSTMKSAFCPRSVIMTSCDSQIH
jgi:hypothetical protein